MRLAFVLIAIMSWPVNHASAGQSRTPRVSPGWKVELIAEAPAIVFPTALVSAADDSLYIGQDPMDMPGPPTRPLDSIVKIRDGRVELFAEKLWAVMGLEWVDDALFVVHAPFLSRFRDRDGDGKADERVDLIVGLGPEPPGFNGINDHIASGIRLGMDGFLYISIGDKGLPRAIGRDGKTIRLHGGGVIRIRPDGSDLEVVSTGERNPLSVALDQNDEIFTYGNDDDSKKWPNSLTHHIVGGHYGYPYEFLKRPNRCLPIVAGQIGGSGTQGCFFDDDGLPERYRRSFYFCDWGLQTITRYRLEEAGGTFRVKDRETLMSAGEIADFRPYTISPAPDGKGFYVVDWAYGGWLADGPKTGRIYRLTYVGDQTVRATARPKNLDLGALDHPSLSVRLRAQRVLAQKGTRSIRELVDRLNRQDRREGRKHALWALDAIGGAEARKAIRKALTDEDPEIRVQAVRSAGIRKDQDAVPILISLLKDSRPRVRRECAVALGKIGDRRAVPSLLSVLGDSDAFASWSIRRAIRELNVWPKEDLIQALRDDRRFEDALKLCEDSWSLPVVESLLAAYGKTADASKRARIVAVLGGLYRRYPDWNGLWFGTNPLAGLFPAKTKDWDRQAMNRVAEGLRTALTDSDASVRGRAIAGLSDVGPSALDALRERLASEDDASNLAAVIGALGAFGDIRSASVLGAILLDSNRSIQVRIAALEALSRIPDRVALRARFSLAYDEKTPPELLARTLIGLSAAGVFPPADLAAFLDRPEPIVRAATLQGLAARRTVPDVVREQILARLDDSSPDVRRAAIATVAFLQIKAAIPRLIELAEKEEHRVESSLALALMPDRRAIAVYIQAVRGRNPDARRTAVAALASLREDSGPEIASQARSADLRGTAALSVERALSKFKPILLWKAIGPFPRTTAPLFLGDSSIDFTKPHPGASGKPVAWTVAKTLDENGRVSLEGFKAGSGDRGGFGYDRNGSPDLAAFATAEIESESDRSAILLIGSSGTVIVALNEKIVHVYQNLAGRRFEIDSDIVRVHLKRGKNRLLLQSRQGVGLWSFAVQVSEPTDYNLAGRSSTAADLRSYAMSRTGDPGKGEAIFRDPKGVGCATCHSAAGKGSADIGPDLTGLALKYDKAEIIRSVLEPSSRLATGYRPTVASLRDGRVVSGIVRSETDDELVLIDGSAKTTRLFKKEIEERKIGEISIMPSGSVDSLSPSEFADLIAFLTSLKTPPPREKAQEEVIRSK